MLLYLTCSTVQPISIVVHPENDTAVIGASVEFTVIVFGDSPAFQWRHNGVNLHPSNSRYSGVNNQTLTILEAVDPNDEGSYTVAVSNPAAMVISNPAILVVCK